MAPQQNSTLIDENLDCYSSLLNLPEELNRYSPILPPRNNQCNKNQENMRNNYKRNKQKIQNDVQEVLPTLRQKQEHQLDHHRPHKLKRSYQTASSCGGRSHRSRSISLYGVNSTTEQGHKEITIWIDDEPRYVSGVTNKTTCDDIIKALIDDEIQNGNTAYCKQSNDGAASRDYSDYVITESWRGIERSYDGNMAILPVWKAWSRVHNELRLTLKHRNDILEPTKQLRNSTTFLTLLKKYLSKLFKFSTKHDKSNKQLLKAKEKCLISKKDAIPDEFLFVILPDKLYQNDALTDPNANKMDNCKTGAKTETKCTEAAKNELLKQRLYRLSSKRNSIRKKKTAIRFNQSFKNATDMRRCNLNSNNCVRRRKDMILRNKLAQKTCKVNELFNREYMLTKELTSKCKLYKLQNELYTQPEKQLELSIGQIQRNIEDYAKQIIKTEHELLELKNEIKQDMSVINNLKRMTLERYDQDHGVLSEGVIDKAVVESTEIALVAQKDQNEKQMKFVDNIYEFCDNNASMLV